MVIFASSQFTATGEVVIPIFGGANVTALKVSEQNDAAQTTGNPIDYLFESGRYVSPDVINITYQQNVLNKPTTTDVASN